jgi:hypothetical protein
VTERGPEDARRALKRLIRAGLAGRSLRELFRQAAKDFAAAGEVLSKSTFYRWVAGEAFPANRKRQRLLGEAVGGNCGIGIVNLRGPAFRGWRRRIMRETEEHMTTHASGAREWRSVRHFPTISHRSEDGRTHLRPVIECVTCHTRETAVRNGSLNDDELFRKKGWEVGKSPTFDVCPMCLKARSAKAKVVKMEDHVKNNAPAEPAAGMTKEDGRILSRLIEDHWDEDHNRYRPGYSDAALAKEVGRPIEWVKARRELDFGGTGEDPGLVDFIAAQVQLNTDMGGLRSLMDELAGSVSELSSQHQKVQRMLEKYRDAHLALQGKANKLGEIAGRLAPPPFKAAG